MFLDDLPVLEDSENCFETGLTDRHLTFALRTQCGGGQVQISTRVWFHNLLGRAYLAVVLPAHVLLQRHTMRALARPAKDAS